MPPSGILYSFFSRNSSQNSINISVWIQDPEEQESMKNDEVLEEEPKTDWAEAKTEENSELLAKSLVMPQPPENFETERIATEARQRDS